MFSTMQYTTLSKRLFDINNNFFLKIGILKSNQWKFTRRIATKYVEGFMGYIEKSPYSLHVNCAILQINTAEHLNYSTLCMCVKFSLIWKKSEFPKNFDAISDVEFNKNLMKNWRINKRVYLWSCVNWALLWMNVVKNLNFLTAVSGSL
jgi:hypothetical protein